MVRIVRTQGGYKQTSLGNSVDFRGDLPPGGVFGDQPQDFRTRLLDVDLSQRSISQQYVSGSWVLVLTADVITAHAGLPQTDVVPIIARIHLGSGGAAHSFEVNAYPSNTIQLPAAVVNVELRWDTLPEYLPGIAWDPYSVPLVTRVRGTLQRSFAATPAFRSYLGQMFNAGGGLISWEGPVPPFAKDCMVYANEGHHLFNQAAPPNNVFTFYEDTLSMPLLALSAADLSALYHAGERIKVPGSAKRWVALLDTNWVGTDVRPWRVDFGIAL